MTEPDTGSLILLTLALGAVMVLASVFIDWRHVMQRAADLPLWSFLRRQGVGRDAIASQIGQRALQLAELRCAACGSRHMCAASLGSGSASPVADCPNAALFAERPSASALER
jgi:hypothetical protein